MRIRAVVAIAGVVQARDDGWFQFTEECLRMAADPRKGLSYDEATRSLIYEGPAPTPRITFPSDDGTL